MPHNLDAERAVLGAILIQNDALDRAAPLVSPPDFFREAHRRIFAAIGRLRTHGAAIDLITLKEQLGRTGELDEVGGPAYLASLVDGLPRATNVAHYARIVQTCAVARRAIAVLTTARETLYAHSAASLNGLTAAVTEALACVLPPPDDAAVTPPTDLPTLLTQLAAAPPRPMLLGDLLAAGAIAMVHGDARAGKTWTALELALALATGTPAFGLARLAVPMAQPVLYVGNEDSLAHLTARLGHLLAGRGLATAEAAGLHLLVGRGISLDAPDGRARLQQTVTRTRAALVIIDPVRSVTAGADQSPTEWRPVAEALHQLAQTTSAAILLVHHDQKPQAGIVDTRRRAHRASGGGIFASVEAPIHAESLAPHQTLLTPDGFKHAADPAPILWTRHEAADGRLQLRAETPSSRVAEDISLDAHLLEFLRHNPGRSTVGVAKGLRRNKQLVIERLERLSQGNQVDCVLARRGKQWFIREPAQDGVS